MKGLVMLYTLRLPCTWDVTMPRLLSTARCCETTGCDCSRQFHNSETQVSSPCSMAQRIFRRKGWPQAFNMAASSVILSIIAI
jgi:hypothetical protein